MAWRLEYCRAIPCPGRAFSCDPRVRQHCGLEASPGDRDADRGDSGMSRCALLESTQVVMERGCRHERAVECPGRQYRSHQPIRAVNSSVPQLFEHAARGGCLDGVAAADVVADARYESAFENAVVSAFRRTAAASGKAGHYVQRRCRKRSTQG